MSFRRFYLIGASAHFVGVGIYTGTNDYRQNKMVLNTMDSNEKPNILKSVCVGTYTGAVGGVAWPVLDAIYVLEKAFKITHKKHTNNNL